MATDLDAAAAAAPPAAADEEPTELERIGYWLDARTGLFGIARTGLRKVFPDHWSFLLGEIALFCFVILLATGTFLTFFYQASSAPVKNTRHRWSTTTAMKISAVQWWIWRISSPARTSKLIAITEL